MHKTKVRTVGPMHNFFSSRMVHIMEPCYRLLMMFHLFGLFYNVRLLRSCFKDKTKYAVLQKSRPLMICQSILQLILLSLNANEATMAFTNEQQEEWCGTNSILMTSVGFLMIYNILAMLAIEHHTIVGLTKAISPKVALIFLVVISTGIGLLLVVSSAAYLCSSHLAITVACLLIMGLVLVVSWRICTHTEDDTEELADTTTLLNFLSKNKMSVFYTILISLGITTIIALDVVCSVAYRFQESEETFQSLRFVERVIYLYVMCFAVGISLPLHFRQIIECGCVQETDVKAIEV